jgi:Mrp family chromosome partitioning ATPase
MPWTEAVHALPSYGVDLIPTTVISADPSMIFASVRASTILREAMEQYNVVIIDAPGLTNWTEIVDLKQKIDLAIFAGVAGQTVVDDIDKQVELFAKLSSKETGTVLIEGKRRSAKSCTDIGI